MPIVALPCPGPAERGATRARPWADRLTCAREIRRFIGRHADDNKRGAAAAAVFDALYAAPGVAP